MASFSYDYTISTDTLYGIVDSDRLTLEIRQNKSISIALDYISSSGDDLTIAFLAQLSTPEQTALDQTLAAHTGLPLPDPVNSDGIPLTAFSNVNTDGIPYVVLYGSNNKTQQAPREGSEVIKMTHNYCDPTTWYWKSQRISSEVLTQDSATQYSSQYKNWIDMDGGLLHDVENIVENYKTANPGDPHAYLPVVTVSGVVQKRRPPHLADWTGDGANYDYVIDHANGVLTFRVAPAASPVASYSYATSSEWIGFPQSGKMLVVENAEIQWTTDVVFNADIIQEAQVPVVQTPDPLNDTHWFTVKRTIYKSFVQISDEARGAYPQQGPVSGSPSWRGTGSESVEHAPLIYSAVKEFKSSDGARMKIYLGYSWHDENGDLQISVLGADNTVAGGGFGGTRATATFYAVSVTET